MTHRSRLTAIGIDVPADVHEVATRFWRSAFGSDHDGLAQAGYASIGRERGLDAFIQALDAGGQRIDLDIETDDVDAEVRRLEALGATRVQPVLMWWVMQDPVGLLFCVVQPQQHDFRDLTVTNGRTCDDVVGARERTGTSASRRLRASSTSTGRGVLRVRPGALRPRPGPGTPKPWWSGSSPPVREPTSSMSASVPASSLSSSQHRRRELAVIALRRYLVQPLVPEELLAGIDAAINEVGGRFTMRYTTVVVTAARTRG
jgi:predicted enzyme related to lactoylglutathione lyase